MKFKILGPLDVVVDGNSVTPKSAKIGTLLSFFCIKSGLIVSKAVIMDALWPDDAPRTAGTAIHVYVSKLRKYLDKHGGCAEWLLTKPNGYLFDPGPGKLDLHEFDRLSQHARTAELMERPVEALSALQEACSLWRGSALVDAQGMPAFGILARQLDEKRIDALERKFDLQLALGQHKEIISELCGHATEYPMWETVNAQLMIALYRSGRVAESLEVYRKIRSALILEIGLEPGARLQGLHRSILRRDLELDQRPYEYVAC